MIALPCMRIKAPHALGSGTVIYSQPNEAGEHSTYLLTNHHVVESAIKIEDEWSALLRAKRKVDKFEMVEAHAFLYQYASRAIGGTMIQADIVAYDQNEDLALLKLRSHEAVASVAALFPRGGEHALRIGMPVVCVGAGLGERPVQTIGILSQFGEEIDRREFWLSSAPGIFGNSGGALFLDETYELIGVPARIAVTYGQAITHLMFAIPITRIYGFLEEQRFRFIYDPAYTEAGEVEERARIREEEERKAARASSG
jgi:S1-C subfamily serine protease